jgi:hypothetical protein
VRPPATIAPAIPPTSNNVDNCALSAGLRVAKTSHRITVEMTADFCTARNETAKKCVTIGFSSTETVNMSGSGHLHATQCLIGKGTWCCDMIMAQELVFSFIY